MRKIFLLCNAHLDPVWLWRKNSGAAEAISTFRVAADFCERYDGFIFNHNEALLYEIVEREEPQLFERIKKLVADGKWNIIGGWYIQPDLNMPCGESIIEQINVGRKYFEEKFGVRPTVGFSADAFGHSRGLVQILRKTGYENYIFLRPGGEGKDFIWKGYDGSEIIAHRIWGNYSTLKGKVVEKIKFVKDKCEADKDVLILWGIGNHGGGPSAVDMEGIAKLDKELDDARLIHSTGDEYFRNLDKNSLEVVETGLNYCNVGCYTSMSRVKKAHRRAENALSVCKKITACAGMKQNEDMEEAKKQMLFNEFHDILPGTAIKIAEEDALRELGGAEATYRKYIDSAFLKLTGGQKKAKQGEIPVLVYNPHPYRIKTDVEFEFILENQNWTDNEYTYATAYDEEGSELKTQHETESSSLNLDWVKRVVFSAELEPMSMNRFDCKLKTVVNYKRISDVEENENVIILKSDKAVVEINKKTGLLDLYTVGGRNLVEKNSGRLDVYFDNEDPWAMRVDSFNDYKGTFTLLSEKEAEEFGGCRPVSVTESGAVRQKAECLFKYGNSYAVVTYTLSRESTELGVDIKLYSNNRNVMVKYSIDTTLANSDFYGQTMFGKEKLLTDKKEVCYQKWCSLKNADGEFFVFNKQSYGGSSDGKQINISLLRTPSYSAHPIGQRPIVPEGKFTEHMDMGERNFSFKLDFNNEYPDFTAQMFNEELPVLSFFPSGDGEKCGKLMELDNKNIILSSVERQGESIFFRLYNSSETAQKADIKIGGNSYSVEFTPYEIKQIKNDYLYQKN